MTTSPISLDCINELFIYNYWARDRQLQACAALSQEQFLREMGSSFPSVRDTLVHLASTEWVWLERWRGRSPRTEPSPQEFPTLAAITERWRTVERDMREFLAALTVDALEQPLTYTSMKGDTFTYPLWRPMLHVLNHQSYHRGQVTALLRQLGVKAPTVDFLAAHRAEFRQAA